jgi:hypothetical protein
MAKNEPKIQSQMLIIENDTTEWLLNQEKKKKIK